MPSLAERMMRLFSGHKQAYGTHGTPEQKNGGMKWEIKGTARTVRAPVTTAIWESHLAGKIPLGIIPINEDNECVWGSIDVDDYTSDLLRLVDRIEREKFPLVPGRSKSGGLHLYLFLTRFAPASLVQAALKNMAAQLGLAGSEIFPKQAQVLTERGDLGNWIITPYYANTYGGKIREQVGIRKTGAELTVEQFLIVAEAAKIAPEALTQWADARPRASPQPSKAAKGEWHAPSEPFGDGPVCLQIMARQGVGAGGQSNALLMMGIYYKRVDPMGWKERLEQANRDFLQPPGTSDGLVSVIKSLEKKDYNYTCKTEPMASHCNSSACRIRRYGVGEEGDYPAISGMSKLNVEPPIWFVDVNDTRLEIATDDLLNYPRFIKVCAERNNVVYNFMSQATWYKSLGPVMQNCTNIDAPPEVGKAGQFKEHLEEFLTNRQKGRSKDDILNGRPWEAEEEKRHYFRLKDLQKFLERENVKDMTRGQITQRIKHLGGGDKFLNIKGRGVNTWWLSVEIFEHRPKADLPGINGDVL